ncbi:MAG: zf-HC2 domain-containing protein [Clostridiales bacterium]|nr:zf-HC2 domain-containing protein [Clostridiales bacterium]
MDCRATYELIMKYFDRDLSKEQEVKLYKHLDTCDSCSAEFRVLKDALSAVEESEMEDPPSGFEERVLSSIRENNREKEKIKIFILRLLILSTIVVGWIGLAAFILYTPVIDTIFASLDVFDSMASDAFIFLSKLWYAGLILSVRIFSLGRTIEVVIRAFIESYSVFMLILMIFMSALLKLYGYLSKTAGNGR